MKQEVDNINKKITIMEFILLKKKKRESTELLPSGRHVGQHKVVAEDDDLAHLHTVMINIGLTNGVALPRWKKCVDIMIEKIK